MYIAVYNKYVPTDNDGFLDASFITALGNKKIEDWMDMESSQELIKYVESMIPNKNVIKAKSSRHRHTWTHPIIAIEIARWTNYKIAADIQLHYIQNNREEQLIDRIHQIYNEDYNDKLKFVEAHYDLSNLKVSNRDINDMANNIIADVFEKEGYIELKEILHNINLILDKKQYRLLQRYLTEIYPQTPINRIIDLEDNIFLYEPTDYLYKLLIEWNRNKHTENQFVFQSS